MGDNFAKLAQEIHKRDNKKAIGPCIGIVTKATQPIIVEICDGAVVLEQGINARVCKNVIEHTYTAQVSDQAVTVTYPDESVQTVKIETDEKLQASIKEVLKKGDEVFCVPCEGEQTWIIVDKVVS